MCMYVQFKTVIFDVISVKSQKEHIDKKGSKLKRVLPLI